MKSRLLGVTAALALLMPAYQAHPSRPIDRLPLLMCTDATTRPASRSAFQTLHRLFPTSEWARSIGIRKYWY